MLRRAWVVLVSVVLVLTSGVASSAREIETLTFLTGTVVDAQGRGIPNVVVSAQRGADGMGVHIEAEPDGSFAIPFEGQVASDYRLRFSDRRVEDGPSYATTVRTRFFESGEVPDVGAVRVVRAYGWGSSTIKVTVRGPLRGDFSPVFLHLKDARGRIVAAEGLWVDRAWEREESSRTAVFRNVAAGRYRAMLPKTGQSVVVRVAAGKTAQARVRMKAPKRHGDLEVRVTPFPRAGGEGFVDVIDRHGRLVETDLDGVFRDLPTGRYTVRTSIGERTYEKRAVVRHDRTTSATLHNRRAGGTLAGKVKGVRHGAVAKVVLKGVGGTKARYEKWTDDGRYAFRGIKPGRYRVVVQDVSGVGEPRFTIGAFPDAYYRGATYRQSRVVRVKEGRTTRLGAISFRR